MPNSQPDILYSDKDSGALPVALGGTNSTNRVDALNNLLPSQISNSGKFLSTDGGGNIIWNSVVSSISTVGVTGNYNDLIGIPTIPTAQVNSDWNAVSGLSVILNKPTIPILLSQLTNDPGYITSSTAPVLSVAGRTGTVTLTKTDVGLGNVDNTTDLNKPVSTATQTALNLKENVLNKNIAGGYVGLGADSKVLNQILPDGIQAVGDGRRFFGAVASSGSSTVTCTGANFTSVDVGKLAIVITENAPGTIRTITSITNSNTIVLSGTAGINTTISTGYLIWGTDASTAIQAAIDAAALNTELGDVDNPNMPIGTGKTSLVLRGQLPDSLFIIANPIIVKSGVIFDCDATIANLIPSRNVSAIQINKFTEVPKLELEACYGGGVQVGTGYQNRIKIGTLSTWHTRGDTTTVTGLIATPSSTGGAISNGTYYFIVTAIDSFGGESALSAETSQTMAYGTTTGSIALAWTAYAGAVSYNVYSWSVSKGQSGFYNTVSNSLTITNIYGGSEGFAVGAGTAVSINGFENEIDRLFLKNSKTGLFLRRAGDTEIGAAFIIGADIAAVRATNTNQLTVRTLNIDSCGTTGGTGSLGGIVLDNYCNNVSMPNVQVFEVTGVTTILPQIVNIGPFNSNKNTMIRINLNAALTGGIGSKIANAQDVVINQLLTNSTFPDSASNVITTALVYGSGLSGEINVTSVISSSITPSSGTQVGTHIYQQNGALNGLTVSYLPPLLPSENHRFMGAANTSQTATANQTMYSVIEIPQIYTANGVEFVNGATVSGNVLVGLYKVTAGNLNNRGNVLSGSTLIASSVSTAQSGASGPQIIDFTSSPVLTPGKYFIALMFDNSTSVFQKHAGSSVHYHMAYINTEASFVLPSTAPAGTGTTSQNPGVRLRGTSTYV